MSNDHKELVRMGYRMPRTVLLPPYMAQNPYFVELAEAMDAIMNPLVDAKIDILRNLRNVWSQSPETEAVIQDHQLIPFETWPQPERDILVKQTNMLGMKLTNAGIVSDNSYQTITRFLGRYWFEKGTGAFIEFMNFCLGTRLTVVNLWTNDYEHFVAEGDASIGTPIWDGGDWYPTTHVSIKADGGFTAPLDPQVLISFFYEIANYNLVLESLDISFTSPIVDDLNKSENTLAVVALGVIANNVVVAHNLFRYGADAPPTVNTGANRATFAYALSGTVTSSTLMLGEPSTWIADNQGRKFPVYSDADMVNVSDSSYNVNTYMGNLPSVQPDTPAYAAALNALYSPTHWIGVPSASRSTARIPAWSSQPVRIGSQSVPTKIVSRWRYNVLVNPTGFLQLEPGRYVPYWT